LTGRPSIIAESRFARELNKTAVADCNWAQGCDFGFKRAVEHFNINRSCGEVVAAGEIVEYRQLVRACLIYSGIAGCVAVVPLVIAVILASTALQNG